MPAVSDANSLRRKTSATDKDKLDEYFQSIREAEILLTYELIALELSSGSMSARWPSIDVRRTRWFNGHFEVLKRPSL